MASKLQPSVLLLILVVFLPAVAAHNITRILSEFPNFGTFNSLLNRTSIAQEINRRKTITVLALDDGAVGSLSSLPEKTLAHVLSIHVILDYYDAAKLKGLKRRSALLTTLFQTTGVAKRNMGYVNFTRVSSTQFEFGSAVPGSPLVASYVKTVASRPYNISVLQISAAILPPGISTAASAPFGAPIAVKNETEAPASASAPAPASSPAPDVDDEYDAEAEAPESESDSPANAPEADELAEDDESEGSSPRRVGGVILLAAAGVALLALAL